MSKKIYKETDTHIYFWKGIFSNFYPVTFMYKGHEFANTEQAFMWAKAIYFNDIKTANLILKTTNPQEAKRLGRKVKNFNRRPWLQDCEQYMFQVNMEKWKKDSFKKAILDTGDKIIVESCPVDRIWGVGLSQDDPLILDSSNWKGLNLLGKVLMKVRKSLKVL